MKLIVADLAQVKASGGIRDAATAKVMVDNGATRLGCSANLAVNAATTTTAQTNVSDKQY